MPGGGGTSWNKVKKTKAPGARLLDREKSTMTHEPTGVHYAKADKSYFEQRGLQRYAGIWSLWASRR